MLDELQTTTKNLLVVQPADVVCATCQQQYCDFLSSVLERQAELVEVNEALQPGATSLTAARCRGTAWSARRS